MSKRAQRTLAPFHVERDGEGWTLVMRLGARRIIWCETQREAIDYAYKNWPWWP